MRNAFIEEITKMAKKDDRIVLLVGDLGYKIFDDFKEKFPKRFFNVGIAEANMVNMAAGLAHAGFKPFVYSIAPFVTLRCCEQIRNNLAYNNKNVVIVGGGAGLTYGHNGPTHHSIEDIALFRPMPNMKILCPGDPFETTACVRYLAEQDGPAYLRLGRAGEEKVHSGVPLIQGGIKQLAEGNGVTILSTGNMLPTAVKVQKILNKRIACGLVSVPVVKPLNVPAIVDLVHWTDTIVTLEEHNIIGGLGSAVTECLMESNLTLGGFKRFGIQDCFESVSGDREYLRKLNRLDPALLAEDIEEFVNDER